MFEAKKIIFSLQVGFEIQVEKSFFEAIGERPTSY